MKYVIAPQFEIVEKKDLSNYDWYKPELHDEVMKTGEGVLIDNFKKTMYVVNPVIKHFVQGFQKPQKVKTVAKSIAAQAGCEVKLLKDTVVEFMDDMYDMGVLVTKKERKKLLKVKARKEQTQFESGTLLADYIIVKVLAKKTKITIYLATRTSDQEQVVIKAQDIDPQLKPKKRKKFIKKYLQEFRLIEEVQSHPGVCKFIEYIELENVLLAVLEFVRGTSLRRAVKKNSISLSGKLIILEQFLDVMAHLHRKEVIHGDLHSANLMVSEDLTVKIIDFNLSNHAVPHPWEILREGGVYQYLPPEKVSNTVMQTVTGPADFRSEVFQIGVLIYLLLYEKMPFSGARYKELGDAIKNQELEYENKLPNGEIIPDHVLQLLQKSMQKNPAKRFKSAVALYKYYVKHNKKLQQQ